MPKGLIGMDQKVSSQVGEPGDLSAQMFGLPAEGGAYVLQEWYVCATW